MAQPHKPKQGSPTVADYRTVQPFHAFGALYRAVRNFLVKQNIIRSKPAPKASKPARKASKPAPKSSKSERRRH